MGEIKAFMKSRSKMNLLIIAINVLIFLIMELRGNTQDSLYILWHGGSYMPFIRDYGEYYRLFTSMFLHFGIGHLFNNMLVLIFLGDTLEGTVGKIKYLIIYLGGGLMGSFLSYYLALKNGSDTVAAGASGAVFAVIGALLYLVIVNKGQLQEINGKRLMLMASLSIYQGFASANVDNAAHVGGLMGGFILAIVLYRKPQTPKFNDLSQAE